MEGNFTFCNPTKLYFGDEAQNNLRSALEPYGKNVLLVYGGGSIKSNGIYTDVMKALQEAEKNVVELSGVMPNPTVAKLNEGVNVIRKNDIDFILAVGGGSTIDYAKGISVAAGYEGDAWDHFWVHFADPAPDAKIIPVGAVLTMAGTGSEMNGGSVITNPEQKLKIGKVFGERVIPKFAILNPKYTYSVPKHQMVAGIYDVMSHILEQYISGDDDTTSDYIAEGLMRSLIHSSLIAIDNPLDYEARSNIMWTATWALNGLIRVGKPQDWMVHMIGQAIGAYTDSTHGMTLSAVSLSYYKYIMNNGLHRFARFAKAVWGISPDGKSDHELAEAGLNALKNWMEKIGVVTNVSDLGVTPDMIEGIAQATLSMNGGYRKLSHDDIVEVIKKSL